MTFGRFAAATLLVAVFTASCSDDKPACVGVSCADVQPCTGSSCDDSGLNDAAVDEGNTSTADASQDAEAEADAAPDVSVPDMGPDAMADAQMDMDVVFTPVDNSTLFEASVPFIFRDADRLGGGAIAVGTTPDNFVANESREAVAVHYDPAGNVVWASRFGDPSNDQFMAVARRGNDVLLGGVSRGYSVGNQNNNDALLVRVTTAGFGEAFNWGTTGDELLYGLFDGGQLAAWIGVGEAGTGDNRDGLVVAFDQNLQVLWATRFETGADDVFFDGAVAGNQVVVVGNTGVRNGTRRALVAAVSDGAVAWARRATADNTDATAALREGNSVLVAGGVGSGNGTQPAIARFAADGSVSGVRFQTGGSATNVRLGDQRDVVAAYGANRSGMLLTWDGNNAKRLPLEPQLRATFLSTPLFEVAGQPRTVFQSPSDSFVDLPFSLTPQSLCSATAEDVNIGPVLASDFEPVTLTPTSLSFTGGAITDPRITATTATGTGMACQP